ncbi:MAG TPA: tryptophan--tRNA ligase [Clostridiales bacterium]|nr:tryptophan--tRNA ligase [Clostridiales bacterium]
MKDIILTADRPTGKLHIGHYIGSIASRIALQNEGNFDKMYVMIADAQALTDNAGNVQKVKDNILNVALDYLACGLDPKKCTIFIQSEVPALTEMTFYFLNLVTLARLKRNPTVKTEIKLRGFEESVPVGFLTYPVSQTADIVAFNTTIVPVGEDQNPMIEQAREIVRSFNTTYSEVLVMPKAVVPKNKNQARLVGTDGKNKMSKSLGNCIFLSDEPEIIKQKIMSMYTDPDHIHVSDPGKVEGNTVFEYLDAFVKEDSFEKYLPEYNNLDELKAHYIRGGLGDVKIKLFLNNILQELLKPIRERRKELEKDPQAVYEILFKGSDEANKVANATLEKMKSAMGIDYRNTLKNK